MIIVDIGVGAGRVEEKETRDDEAEGLEDFMVALMSPVGSKTGQDKC